MDKYTQYKLKITDKNKELVKTYLQKMKKFVEKYNIEKELYNDIEEMVFEKLSNQKKLDQLSITKILKEVWEPEVIFADYISDSPYENPISQKEVKNNFNSNNKTKKDDDIPFYEKYIKDWQVRDNENAIIYWISWMLAKKSNLPVWLINALFIISIILTLPIGWMGIVIYFILWFILPIKWIDYKWKTLWEYFKIQLHHLFTDFFHNIFNSIKKIPEWLWTTSSDKMDINDETALKKDKKEVEETLEEEQGEPIKQIKESPQKTTSEAANITKNTKQTKTFLWKIISVFSYIFVSIFNILIFILKTIMKYIEPILRFIIFATISIILFALFITFLAILAVSFTNLTFSNIDFTSILPTYAKRWFLAWTISIWIFLVASIMYTFGHKTSKYTIIWGFTAFIIMLLTTFSASISLLNTYWNINFYTQEAQIELDSNKNITLNIWTNNEKYLNLLLNFWNNRTTLENTTGTMLKMEVKYKFLWNNNLENIFRNTIMQPKFIKNDSIIEIENLSSSSTEKIPYIPIIERHTIIYVPEWYTIKFNGYIPYVTNAYTTFNNEKYKYNHTLGCYNKEIWFKAEEWIFACMPDKAQINDAKNKYLINYIIENFDDISPITHVNIYKRDYTNYIWGIEQVITSDWNFMDFNWRDKDTLEIEFSDMSLDINAILDVIETETWATIPDFRINRVGIDDWNFDSKYYNSIEAIAKWLKELTNKTTFEDDITDYMDTPIIKNNWFIEDNDVDNWY